MSGIEVELAGGRTAYAPGETVEGVASWELPEAPERLELRLFWYTEGRGDSDQQVVVAETVPAPGPRGRHPFRLALPLGPYSFSGQLVSLLWAVELVAVEEQLAGRADLVVGPGGREVRIDGEPPPEGG